jgi:beta-ketoacyl-acyl-carrier-protein synthase II
MDGRRRVVITGLAAVSPLGANLSEFWEGLTSGRSGIRRISLFDASDLPCQIGGEIPNFVPENYMDRKEARRVPRCCQITVAAAVDAMKDAGFDSRAPDPERAGIFFGTAVGGVDKLEEGAQTLKTYGHSKVSPFMLPTGIPNIPAFMIAERFQMLGPNATISTACATGTQAIGGATEYIRHGAADMVITGGVEALISDWGIAGFCAMRALPLTFNNNPTEASRPFDARREGFVLSEGCGVLVLEELKHAQQRGARIYAEIGGHASSSDAFHFAAPDPEGKGPARAMRWALQDANMPLEAVDYINAHGTSTPLNDPMETKAIKAVFGEHAYKLAVSSIKSMIGHAMGAAGALEAIACILTIWNKLIPPTINYTTPDPECDLDYVPNQARPAEVNVTLSNSFGLGGQNACLVVKKYIA